MKNLIFILISSIVLFTSCDRNVGNSPKQTFDLKIEEPINGVRVALAGEVTIDQNEKQSLVLQTQQEVMDHLSYEVHNGILVLSLNKNLTNYDFNLHISIPSLNKVQIDGSANVEVYDVNSNNAKLDLDLNGSGNITVENASKINKTLEAEIKGSGNIFVGRIKSEKVNIKNAGSGNINLIGATQDLNVSYSGSGNLDASQLISENVTVNNAGSSDIKVHCNKTLNIKNSGSGNIHVSGNPSNIL